MSSRPAPSLISTRSTKSFTVGKSISRLGRCSHGNDYRGEDSGGPCGQGWGDPGELITAKVDLVLGNDITAPVAIKEFERLGWRRSFDRDKIALVPDHFVPNKDIKAPSRPNWCGVCLPTPDHPLL